ncbi:hypothetical protein HYN43_015885 [Mucilaginibacter celer]|uniref:Uncharacterized protein n=2 Tax=Mucilaginibacter celer TaxID=2305508 RepID=A0A494VZE7_9SPHI|nr:hypothetical protein HYN43_015885 [Mucilaginibacter celer]
MADFYNPKVDKTTDKYVDRVYWFVMDLSFNKLMGLVPSLKHAVLLNDDKVHIARVVLISKLLKQNPNIDKVCQDAYWVSYHMKDVDQTGSLQNYNPRFKNVL